LDVLPDGFVLGGTTYASSSPQGHAYVVRTDLDGEVQWAQDYGDAFRWACNGITVTSDLGLAMAGVAGTASGDDRAFVMKLDGSGAEEWTAYAGGDSADYFSNVIERADGHWVACGSTRSWEAFQQIYLVGFQPGGQLEWERQIGGTSDSGGAEVRQGQGSGYVLTGYNTLNLGERDVIVTTTDVDGYFTNGNNYGDGRPADGYSVDTTADGGFVVAGWAEQFGPGLRSIYVVKVNDQLLTANFTVETYFDPLDVPDRFSSANPTLFPNPAQPGATVQWPGAAAPARMVLLDLQGRVLLDQGLSRAQRAFRVPEVPSGLYRVRLFMADGAVLNAALEVQR
jgi:hypothetical protein